MTSTRWVTIKAERKLEREDALIEGEEEIRQSQKSAD